MMGEKVHVCMQFSPSKKAEFCKPTRSTRCLLSIEHAASSDIPPHQAKAWQSQAVFREVIVAEE